MVYVWSPVLLKEVYCTLAIDAFLMPALAGLVYCIATNRRLAAAIPLAICAGLRPALLLLVPVFGRRLGVLGVMLTVAFLAIPFLPFWSPDVPAGSYVEGNLHVWRHYEYNSLCDNLLRAVLEHVPAKAENTLVVGGVTLIQPGEPLSGFLARLLGLVAACGVTTYLVIRFGAGLQPAWKDPDEGLLDLLVMLATLLVVSPVVHPWLAIWLLPLLAVRPSGVAWLTLPALVCLSYLTHLEGPDAADVTLLGGVASFRAVEYGLFGLLALVDVFAGGRLLRGDDRLSLGRRPGTEEDILFHVEPADDPETVPV
jgi:hypothetical protein